MTFFHRMSELSTSEQHGQTILKNMIDQAPAKSTWHVYSAGISTAGHAEQHFAELHPNLYVSASTLDEKGIKILQERFQTIGKRINPTLEDFSQPLPYDQDTFDMIYARLSLHYLSHEKLIAALVNFHHMLRKGGILFVVVRNHDNDRSRAHHVSIDGTTKLTSFFQDAEENAVYRRFEHTVESISSYISGAGFHIASQQTYQEQLFLDFERTILSPKQDELIEIVANK